MSRAVAIAAVLTPALASAAVAQRRLVAGVQPIVRRDARPVFQQPAAPTTTGPDWSVLAGISSGDDEYDLGIALGVSARWRRSDLPVTIRGDGYYAYHSGDFGTPLGGFDLTLNLFGVMGSAEYHFTTESSFKPYAFGGLGIFYGHVNDDYDGLIDDSIYDSSTDLGFGVGGGVKITDQFGLEIRLIDAGGFTTLPIMAVWHF